ncbi:ABC transporter permease [Flavobacterium sp. CS20]|uniref:ABC transporter permease n=1 Tax=Flavobacterium sp. CS20 TaxID=2775246 RepID=UPI001B39D04C|nr:ABC transporter permease [Flavobacterium sp. CS20]QTY26857.1 ABC transporter permease [Flavobacterium sp. CS20]
MKSPKGQSLFSLALQKFKTRFWGVFSLSYIVFCALIALLAYVIAPDASVNANQMQLAIHSKSPGFETLVIEIPNQNEAENSWTSWLTGQKSVNSIIPIQDYQIKNNFIEITPFDATAPKERIAIDRFKNVREIEQNYIYTKTYWLGTDRYGRDMLSRLLIGTRVSLSIGFVAVFISLVIGIFIGALGGYFGGAIDQFVMWLINVTWSIPTLLLVIALTLALGKGFWQVFIAVGLTMWVEVARVVRGQVKSVKQMPYITAAHALGYSHWRIVTKHILPNIMAPVIVISAANFAAAILIESGLSFLGIGAQPPIPTWGNMIKEHYNYIVLGQAHLAIIPGLAIMSLVMAFMMIGNTLRDAFDVKN